MTIRSTNDIFPEWHSHPMTDTTLHDWYQDVIRSIQSVREMKEEILSEDCPYRREAKATYALESLPNRTCDEMEQFYQWLRQMVTRCQEEQKEVEQEREQMREQVEKYLLEYEAKMRKKFEKQLRKEMAELEEDLLSGRTPLSPQETDTEEAVELETPSSKPSPKPARKRAAKQPQAAGPKTRYQNIEVHINGPVGQLISHADNIQNDHE